MEENEKHFNKLLSLVKLEYQYEQQQYKQKLKKLNLADRIAEGISLYPFVLTDSQFDISGNLSIILEPTKKVTFNSQFKNGSPIEVFADNNTINGIIKGRPNNTLTIVLTTDVLPDWLDEGKLGINIRPDEKTFACIKYAMEKGANANKDVKRLVNKLIGIGEPHFRNNEHVLSNKLNSTQQAAITQCLNADDIGIIHGPPGTGKTTTLVAYVKEEVKRSNRILACAPSNTAVDWLTEKLADANIKVIRIGNPIRINETIIQHSLEYKLNAHPEAKMLDNWRKEAKATRKKALKYKRSFGAEDRAERKRLLAEAKEWQRQIKEQQKLLINKLLANADVICATLTGSDDIILKTQEFDLCIIDECAQATEPACWVPILKCKKVILAGDPHQLPATVKCNEAAKKGLNVSLMERLLSKSFLNIMLSTQYRMNKQIMQFSSEQFYNNKLKAHSTNADSKLENWPAISFIDTAGSGFYEDELSEHESKLNTKEAEFCIKYLSNYFTPKHTIGIMAPYRAQVNYLQKLLTENERLSPQKNVVINTIDSFQGQEKEVIIISLTRSNEKGVIGFLKDYRRMNVALTRAKKSLIVIGDSGTISNDKFYSKLLTYFDKQGAYHSVWEFSFAFE